MRINTAGSKNPSWKKSEAENMKHGALENRLGPHNPQTYQWKAVTDYSKKKASYDNLKIELNEESNSTLIGRYFEDQRLKHDCKQKDKNSKTDRKIYQFLYKQKQRQSVDFKEMERQVRKAARLTSKYRNKERKYTYLSMKSARDSADYKEKERVAKNSSRQSDESKIKERRRKLKSMKCARDSADFKEKERVAKRSSRQSDELNIKER